MSDSVHIPAARFIAALCVGALICTLAASIPAVKADAAAPVIPHAIVTQDLAHGITPQDLVNDLVGSGVSVSNVTYTGTLQAAGRFTGGLPATGIDHGIILGSGDIALVPGPNTLMDATAQNMMPGDAELTALSGYPTFDADILEFDFVPMSDTVFFQYAFGSEEYNEWVGTQFNDVFAFLIDGQNCAVVPGTGDPVSINTINNARNPAFYHNNDFHPTSPYDTQLDGLTVPFLCQRTVNPGQTYHIKLAIADAGDNILDSDVFIQGGSFSSGPTPTPTPTFTPTEISLTGTPTPVVSPSMTPTPGCGPVPDYVLYMGAGAIDPGTQLVPGSQCDDCSIAIPLPFTYSLYGAPFDLVHADSNGNLQFTTDHDISANTCLPYPRFSDVIAPLWDDLDMRPTVPSGLGVLGIYTSLAGTAPDRIFNIEWRACLYNDGACGGEVNFEVSLYEGQAAFDLVYDLIADGGAGATVGVQKGIGSQITEYECNTPNSLWPGLLLSFVQEPCATATPTEVPINTPTTTPTDTAIPTTTPTNTPIPTPNLLVGHLTWQAIPQNDSRSILPLTVTLRIPGLAEVNFPQQNTDAAGFFTMTVSNMPFGVYNWRIQGPDGLNGGNTTPGFLANCGIVTLAGAAEASMENGTMKGGDADNNNIVNSADFNVMKADFGQSGVRRGDFNNDLLVNSVDFNVLKGNFGQAGCAGILQPGGALGRTRR